jgi:hypothetical protein
MVGSWQILGKHDKKLQLIFGTFLPIIKLGLFIRTFIFSQSPNLRFYSVFWQAMPTVPNETY